MKEKKVTRHLIFKLGQKQKRLINKLQGLNHRAQRMLKDCYDRNQGVLPQNASQEKEEQAGGRAWSWYEHPV